MSWPKIKNIIILILLVTNLCLAGFTINRQTQADQLQGQPRSEAITFLKSREIEVQEQIVPDDMVLKPMQVTRDMEQEGVLAEALLGEPVSLEARGAGVYRYFNDSGFIQFHSNGEFSARFYNSICLSEDAYIEKHSAQLLERINFQGTLIRTKAEGGEVTLTYREYWQGNPLFNCQVQVTYRDGVLIAMTGGRRLTGVPEETGQWEQITVATALMRFYNGVKEFGDACTQIQEITPGYILTPAITEPIPMTPIWQIVTDTCVYQLDTLTGQLNRVQ